MSSGGKRVRNASAGAQTLQIEMSGSARLGQALAAEMAQKDLGFVPLQQDRPQRPTQQ